ncbi:uncharacterized protein LOC108675167, partial [Hyalella azteca]|uniref:Uncharacterized protein LOC108675167 n=1 Tax=Hyalella azteca TaxID=294128 RepID=A0A8B7NY27_HYAAZ
MFGSLVQKLQSFSPITSPTTSPTVSPRPKKKFGFGRANRKRRIGGYDKEEIREVQSEPELDYENLERKKDKKFFGLSSDRRKISAPLVGQCNNAPRTGSNLPNGSSPYYAVCKPNSLTSNDCYASAYSVIPQHNNNHLNSAVQCGQGEDIYEDINTIKGPHVSVYNISSSAPKPNLINHNADRSQPRSKTSATNSKAVNSNFNSISAPSNGFSGKHRNISTVDIKEASYKNPDFQFPQDPVKNAPDNHRRLSRAPANHVELRPTNSSQASYGEHKAHHVSDETRKRANNNKKAMDNYPYRKDISVPLHDVIHEPRKLVIVDTRKTSHEFTRNGPPDYHRTLSSDYYQNGSIYGGILNRMDEPYPLPPSPHEDIYDVPSRITRKVGDSRSKDFGRSQVSRTLGKMEGLRQAERVSVYEQFFASLVVD